MEGPAQTLKAPGAQGETRLGFNGRPRSDVCVGTVWMSYDGTDLTNAELRTVLAASTSYPTSVSTNEPSVGALLLQESLASPLTLVTSPLPTR